MRVLVVTTWFPSRDQPTQAPFNLRHVEAIGLLHEVRVIHVRLHSSLPAENDIYEGFAVRRLSLNLRRPFGIPRVLREIHSAVGRFDVLHTMAFSSALVAAVALGSSRVPWVHTEHWNGVVQPSSVSWAWTRLAWLRRILRRPSWLTGVTRQLSDVLAGFGDAATTSVVPCVVENPLPITPAPSASRLRLVSVGGLIERKRPLLTLHTVKRLVDQGHDVALTWVGDGPLREAMLQEIDRLGLAANVTVTGAVDPREVFGFYAAANIFFLPPAQENFFTSAAEALSAGRPVVATRVGGFEDYADESNSVLVDDPTSENLARAILLARDRWSSASAEGIATPIRERFSASRIAGQFDEIYTSITRSGEARR